jgi:hypothetical protein
MTAPHADRDGTEPPCTDTRCVVQSHPASESEGRVGAWWPPAAPIVLHTTSGIPGEPYVAPRRSIDDVEGWPLDRVGMWPLEDGDTGAALLITAEGGREILPTVPPERDLTAAVEAAARALTVSSGMEWHELDPMTRHTMREAVLPLVVAVVAALDDPSGL